MKAYFLYISIFICGVTVAQITPGKTTVNKKTNDDTDFENETVVVERVYEPKVEAAEKLKQTPKISDVQPTKLPVNYGLKDVEAASDFETSTIGADQLPVKNPNPYNNYIRGGFGNQTTILADGYAAFDLDNGKSAGASFDLFSTAADINNVLVDTDESRLNAEGFLKLNYDDAIADLRLGIGNHQLNYYGFEESLASIAGINATEQSYQNLYVSGKYQAFDHAFLDNIDAKVGFFSDNHNANEQSINITSKLQNLNLWETAVINDLQLGAQAKVNLNASNTKFKWLGESTFSFLNVGVNPMISLRNEAIQLDLGANVQYMNADAIDDKSEVYVFPTLYFSYNAIPAFGLYGGLTGGLVTNNYQTLYQENPYLYANQNLDYTENNLEIFAGFRGDIGQNFKYDASAKYQKLENMPFLYKQYGLQTMAPMSNAFGAVYDDGTRTAIQGKLSYTGVSNLHLGTSLTIQNYQLDVLEKPLDKPSVQASVDADYKFLNDKLILGGNLFLVGARNGMTFPTHNPHVTDMFLEEAIALDPYIDLNFHAHYMFLERWGAFIQINNVLNNHYERFLDYEVQGVTGVGGVMFKF